MDYLALVSKPNSEFLLENELNLSFADDQRDVYLPTYAKTLRLRHTHREVTVIRPLYGRYVFLGLIDRDAWMRLFRMKYLTNVIRSEGAPVWISNERIEEVKAFNQDYEIKRLALMNEKLRDLMIGDKVVIAVGPFAGLVGKYVGKNKISLILFGRVTTVNVDRALLIRA